MRTSTLIFTVVIAASELTGVKAQLNAQTSVTSAKTANQTTATTTLTKMQRLFPNNEAMKHGPLSDSLRADRVAHLFVRYGDKPNIRGAAVWFLNKFAQEKHPYDYWGAAGMAIIRLHEQAKMDGLTDEEKPRYRTLLVTIPTLTAGLTP